MIVKPESVESIKLLLLGRCQKGGVNYSEIGRKSGVHPSQASRICRGEFKTISQNVVQICGALGIVVDGFSASETSDPAAAMLIRSVLSIWKGTPDDAIRVVEFLDSLEHLRSTAS